MPKKRRASGRNKPAGARGHVRVALESLARERETVDERRARGARAFTQPSRASRVSRVSSSTRRDARGARAMEGWIDVSFASFVRSRAGWRRRDDESGRDAVGRARTARGVSTLVGLEARAERDETNTDR